MTLLSLILTYPKTALIILSFIVTLFVTIVTHFVTDKELMRTIKAKQKALREEMKKFRDNPEKMMELNKQMMADMPHQMKQSLKVSLVTLIPLLLLFNWLRKVYIITDISNSWIWWYIISSLIFSIILRKVFKLD
jgi:uncharacterized membrane protein (DUF106 family)